MSEDNHPLILPELEIPSDDEIRKGNDVLWRDDALDRKQVSDALTNLVRNEKGPLVVSIDGDWGVGKTFLLKRWQKQLTIQEGYEAIFYNAWEDDFHNDPIISILGQLTSLGLEGFDKVLTALIEFVKKINIGATIGVAGASINIGDALESIKTDFERAYDSQGSNKVALKDALVQLSEKVAKKKEGRPLIFIIDELDRCRPTFAIELLERVKHIFNVPNIIFVLGINKDQLCKSIKSIYGDIDTDIYLRRFIHIEFIVPRIEPEKFCEHMIKRYRSEFDTLPQHWVDLFDNLSFLVHYMRFSLRDIEDCFRSSIFVLKNVGGAETVPIALIGTLIALRLKNEDLYRKYIRKECGGAQVMNYVSDLINEEEKNDKRDRRGKASERNKLTKMLDVLEGSLYAYDQDDKAYQALQGPKIEWKRSKDSLSNRVEGLSKASIDLIVKKIECFNQGTLSDDGIKDISNLIELVNTAE